MAKGRAKRVLFVAYYFPPRGGAGVQRSVKFVKYLRRFGWEPTVLTCTYEKRSAAYDETLLAEAPEGTKVVRVPSPEGFFVRLSRAGLGRAAGLVLSCPFLRLHCTTHCAKAYPPKVETLPISFVVGA